VTLTIAPPPWASIAGSTALLKRKTPRTFVVIRPSHSSGEVSRTGLSRNRAALFTSTSIRPKRSTAVPAAAVAVPSSATSPTTAAIPSPSRARTAGSTSTATTDAPAARNSDTTSRPTPLPAPVTTATDPCRPAGGGVPGAAAVRPVLPHRPGWAPGLPAWHERCPAPRRR
jgi:hypothetical protein